MELDLALDREGVTLQPSDSTDLLDETAWLQQLEALAEQHLRGFQPRLPNPGACGGRAKPGAALHR